MATQQSERGPFCWGQELSLISHSDYYNYFYWRALGIIVKVERQPSQSENGGPEEYSDDFGSK